MAKRIGSRRSSPSGGYNSPRSGRNSLYAYTRRRAVAYLLVHNVQLAVLAIIASVHLHCTIRQILIFLLGNCSKRSGHKLSHHRE